MADNDVNKLELAVQRLDQNQKYVTHALEQMSSSLRELVALQNDHDVLRAEIKASKETNNNRLSRIENSNAWVVRLVGAAVIAQVLAQLFK